MKTKILTTLVFFAVMLTACKDDPACDGEHAANELSLIVADGGYTLCDDTQSGNAESSTTERSHKRTFIAGDKIGFYAVKGDAVVADANNLCLTLTDIGGGILEWQAPSNAPISKYADRFFVYYPYQETLTGAVNPTATDADAFFANVITSWAPVRDQSDYATGYSASDLMVGRGTPGTMVGSNGKYPLDFTLTHKMGLVTISIPPDATAPEFKNFKPYNADGVYYYLLKPTIKTLLEGTYTRNGQAQPYNFDAIVGAGSYLSYNVYESSQQAKMYFNIKGDKYTIPFTTSGSTGDYDLTIQWGDGGMKTIKRGTSLATPITHKYSKTGTYTIIITSSQKDDTKPQIPILYFDTKESNDKLITMDSPILNTGATSFSNFFYGCSKLFKIEPDLFAKNRQITDFSSCFGECTALTEIPAGIFDNNPEVTTFEKSFFGCTAITEIPKRLFGKNPKVTTFKATFYGCIGLTPMPTWELFSNNPEVTTFSNCFEGCTGITMVPSDLFSKSPKVTEFNGCFKNCTALTTAPTGLFANNPEVIKFSECFEGCTAMRTVPSDLFSKSKNVTEFNECFRYCKTLTTVPSDLFANNPEVKNFRNCFFECSALKTIPEGLFAKNLMVTSFNSCFEGCTALMTIPNGLFDNNPKVEDFSSCFFKCSALTTVPEGLFAKNLMAVDFENCFYNCVLLSLNSNIFCNEATEKQTRFAGQEITFSNCFYSCGSSLKPNTGGTAPALWSYPTALSLAENCFYNVTNVTNAADIPADWK